MSCQFSHLAFGEHCTVTIRGSAICSECAAPVATELSGAEMIYCGHSGDIDLFQLTRHIPCPSCGVIMTGYSERCHGLGGLCVDVFASVPVEKGTDEPC